MYDPAAIVVSISLFSVELEVQIIKKLNLVVKKLAHYVTM